MIWSPETGFLAAVLYALDYIALLASQMLLTDSLYVFTLISALSLGVAALLKERGTRWLLLGFGLLLATATLIRPVSYYLIAPVLVGFVVVFASRFGWKRALFNGLLVLLPWLLVVGGWQARNYAVVAEVNQRIQRNAEPGQMLHSVLEFVVDALNADRGVVAMVEDNPDNRHTRAGLRTLCIGCTSHLTRPGGTTWTSSTPPCATS